MAATVSTPAAPRHGQTASGLFGLIVLLILAVAGAVILTVYLLRTATTHTPAVPAPAPFRVLYRQGAQVWVAGPGHSPRLVTTLPASVAGQVSALHVSPDGKRLVLIGGASVGFKAWLLSNPSAQPQLLPAPPASAGAGPWHFVSIAWQDGQEPAVLLTAGARSGTRGLVGRYNPAGPLTASWTPLTLNAEQPISLAPSANELALLEVLAATHDFVAQAAVRLQRLDGTHPSVAIQYLGAKPPAALLWAPDGGTLAVVTQGLAIQKSSGRVVRAVPDGTLPVSFSARGDSVAFLSGTAGAWQIHVLQLHSEYDHPLPAPDGATPRWLGWTPDGKALVYVSGSTLWQVAPDSGLAKRLATGINGPLLSVVPAGAPFSP